MLTFTLDIDFAHTSVLREIGNIRLILDSLAQKFEEELKKEEEDERLILKESKRYKKGKGKVINKNFGLLELPGDNEDEEEEIPFVGETKKKTKKKVTIKEEDKEDKEDKIEEVKIRDIIKEEKEEEKKKEIPKVDCVCGVSFVKRNIARHLRSKNHVEFIALNPNLKNK
jgi:hypothetical protein